MSWDFTRHSGRSEDFLFRPAPGSPGYLTEDHLPEAPASADDAGEAVDAYDLPMHDERRRKGRPSRTNLM